MVKLLSKLIDKLCFRRVIIVNKGTIKAVHDDDLNDFLDSLGILKKIKAGKMKCSICSCPVNLENFQCVYPENNSISVCCSNAACYEKLIAWGKVIND